MDTYEMSSYMTGKTHQLIGLTAATGIILAHYPELKITWSAAATVITGSFFGSLAPDIDQPTANIWDAIPLGKLFGKVTARALGGHRHISHSFIGVLLFSFLITWLAHNLPPNWFFVSDLLIKSFIIGYVAHLLADSFTIEGVPLFWPLDITFGIPPAPFEGVRIVTGKWFENLVIFPGVVLVLLFIVVDNLPRFCGLAAATCLK
jgi:membrane-bound metal-dependent hydrolase YbcI (DUF457 family)